MATIIFYCVIAPLALAWCAYLAVDTVRVCREIDREERVKSGGVMSGRVNSPTHPLTHSQLLILSGALEVR
jgi:hypothetical protein